VHVLHLQLPAAVEGFAGQVDGVGRVDVVGAVAAALVLQAVAASVRGDQVDLDVAAVGVDHLDVDLGIVRRIAATTGHGDRAVDRSALVRQVVVGAVGVGLLAATATAGGVVADQADAGEARVRLQADVVRAGRRAGVGAALCVAALVRTAVVGAVGRRAAEPDVHVVIARAARRGEHQVGSAAGNDHGVDNVVAGGRGQSGRRDALGEHAAATAATAGPVVGPARQAGERRIGLGAHAVGARRRRREGAAVGVAALVRTAVVGAVGRRAAVLDVQVGITARARDRDHQVAGARRHGDGVVHRVAGRGVLARHRHALGERTAGAVAAATAAAIAA